MPSHDQTHSPNHKSTLAELSALASSLTELTNRITGIATRYQGTPSEDVSFRLFEAERSLLAASRKLDKAMRSLG